MARKISPFGAWVAHGLAAFFVAAGGAAPASSQPTTHVAKAAPSLRALVEAVPNITLKSSLNELLRQSAALKDMMQPPADDVLVNLLKAAEDVRAAYNDHLKKNSRDARTQYAAVTVLREGIKNLPSAMENEPSLLKRTRWYLMTCDSDFRFGKPLTVADYTP